MLMSILWNEQKKKDKFNPNVNVNVKNQLINLPQKYSFLFAHVLTQRCNYYWQQLQSLQSPPHPHLQFGSLQSSMIGWLVWLVRKKNSRFVVWSARLMIWYFTDASMLSFYTNFFVASAHCSFMCCSLSLSLLSILFVV